MQSILAKAMQAPDDLVVSLEYVDSKGQATRRIVSPIRFLGGNRFLGLCLCREEPRQFAMDRCHNVRLCRACDFVMPVPVMPVPVMPVPVMPVPVMPVPVMPASASAAMPIAVMTAAPMALAAV
jgi:hypothetical protein